MSRINFNTTNTADIMETKHLLFENQSNKLIDSKTKKQFHRILSIGKGYGAFRSLLVLLLFFALGSNQSLDAQVSAYTKSNTAGTYTAHSGTIIRTAIDNGVSGVTDIGFTFMYAGTSFTQFVASSNGFIVLGSTAPATNNYTPLSTYANAIAAGSNDGEVTGNVRVEVQGSAPNRVCNIQYTDYDYDYSVTTRRGSFQIQLKETSNIVDIIYTQPTATTTTFAVRVGLSGNTTADFSNYQGSIANWAGLTNGAANTSTVNFGSSNNGTRSRPSAGRILRWTPTVSVAPTSITGTSSICAGSSTTLTSAGGSLATDAVDLWSTSSCVNHVYFNPWRVNNFTAGANATTFNSVNGLLNVTSTTADPSIHMPTLGSFNPNTYRYVNIRFRATSVAQPAGIEIFWYNTLYTGANGAQFKNQAVSSTQNVWTTVSIDMLTPTAGNWLHSNVTGWRFDWATTTGVTMDIDFISLSDQPLVGSGSSITVTPASNTTYYTHKAGQTNVTPCTSQLVTVNPLATTGTFQYASGSTQTVCSGSTISCNNVTSPTNGGAGTLSVVWYCGEETSPGNYGNWKESTLAGVSGTTSSANLNAAAGGGTGMNFSLSNYNPLSDFPSNTKFLIIRRAYNSNCGVCVGGCLDQSFYLNLNPNPTITLGSAAAVCPGTTSSTLSYSATTSSPDQYMIDFDAAAEAEGFVDVAYTALPGSPIPLTIPGGAAPATYNGTVKVRVSGTGCESSTNAFTVTINPNPTITLSAVSLVCSGSTSGSLPFSATTNSPNQYSITYDATALGQGFSNVGLTALPASPVGLVVPGAAADDTYNATITVKNTSTGCLSSATGFTIPLGPCLTPTMTTFSPTSACAQSGTSITVTGTNLTGSSVTVNGESASVTASSGTTITFDLPNTASGTGNIVVTNPSGSISSSTIPLSFTVNPLPTVTGTLSACVGSTSTLSGSATAAALNPWVSSNTGIATVTSGGVVSPVSEGTVNITYTNTNGCQRVSSFASNAAPAISVQPSSPAAVCAGSGTPSFTVTATGTSLTYQWQEFISSWNNVSNGGVYSGALTSTLTITAPGAGMNNNRYRCVVSGTCSPSATSDGLATLSVYTAPAISVQPASPASVCNGIGTRTFTVTATGSALTYQWQEFISSWNNVSNGGVYSGATTASLTLTNPLVAMNGYRYRCVVSNGVCSSATTDGLATLSVAALPTIGGTLSACMLSSSTLTGSGTPAGVTPWTSSNTGVATVTSGGVVTGVVGGTSTITYTNNVGCQATATFTVNASTTPTSVTATPALVCNGFTSNLNATSAGNSILWYTAPSGGTLLGTVASGANYNVTPPISASTAYYAEARQMVAAGSQTFNANGSFTVPAGVSTLTAYTWGGGGGGGGARTGFGSYGSGGGGGGGSMKSGTLTVAPAQVYTVTIGAGGTAGNGSGGNGGAGGTTTFTGAGGTISTLGGSGGTGCTNSGGKAGGAGGTGGTFNGGAGASGNSGTSFEQGGGGGGGAGSGAVGGNAPAASDGTGGPGGTGGGGTYGGGNGGSHAQGFSGGRAGVAGTAPGGGGSGASDYDAWGYAGGAGGAGRVVVEWPSQPFAGSCPSVRVPVIVTTTAPVPGTVTGAPASIAAGSTVTYTATGFSGGTFSKFQYQWNTTTGAWTDWGVTNPFSWTATGAAGNTLFVRSAILDINGCFAYSPAVSTFITSQYIGNTATSGNTPATAPACGGWSSTWCAGSGTFTPLTLVQDINYTVENTGSGCTPAMATAYLQAWYTGGTDCTGWGVIGTLGTNTISFNAQISGVHRINVSSSVNVDNNTSCAFAKGWDGPGGASATLRYRQNTTVSNTTSSAAICLSDTKSLTATLGGAHNNPTINWSIVSGGGSISGTTYTPAVAGSVTLRATVGVCTSDVTFTVNGDRTISIASAAPFVCNNVAMTNVTHTTTNVTGIASSSGLPPGVSASYSANTITIGGIPTSDGVYSYTITPTGCGTATATGTITVITTADPASTASALGVTLVAGDLLWSGNSSTIWNLNTNWYAFDGTEFVVPTGTPASSSRVFLLPSTTPGICVSSVNNTTITAAGSAMDVYVGEGATMIINPSQNLEVYGNWTNNGTFNPDASATVKFVGSGAQSIGGVSITNFSNLLVDKASSTLTLNTPANVTNTLTMTAGNIATTSVNILTIGASTASPGSVAWTSGSIVGPLRRYFSSTTNASQASGIFPVGLSTVNRYAQINYTGGLTTGGIITAEYIADVCPVGYAGLPNSVDGQMIQNYENEGYWSITPSGGNLNSATYSLILRGNTLSTVTSVADMSKLRIIKSSGPAHTSWDNGGIGSNTGATGGVSDFTIANTGMTGFSFFNIGSGNANPLPVTMLDFAANCNEKFQVDVNWTTASEQNSESFIIERSRDLTAWEYVSTVNAAGNSNYNIDYSTVDTDPFGGVSYYRMVQVDNNGVETIYGPISVSCVDETNSMIVFPNPTKGDFIVEISSNEDLSDSQLIITDLSGKVISTRIINVLQGKTQAIFENQELQLGTYIIQLKSSNHNIQPVRVVVN
jgi:hypothetical protein